MTSRPLIVSVTLHATFALLVVFGLPMLGRELPEEMPIARMEIVQTVPETNLIEGDKVSTCLLYTSPSPRDLSTSRMPSSA